MSRVLELGCHDGKTISFMPQEPNEYIGLDADWEGGLSSAIQSNSNPKFHFLLCKAADDIKISSNDKVSLILCMETFEHLSDQDLLNYVLKFSQILSGYMFITVPNEKGFIFLVKYLIKLFCGLKQDYSFNEVTQIVLGRLHKVVRNEHKGFDWSSLNLLLVEHFQIISIEGVQFPALPLFLNMQIGMVYKAKIA
jgi:hypothetical protein